MAPKLSLIVVLVIVSVKDGAITLQLGKSERRVLAQNLHQLLIIDHAPANTGILKMHPPGIPGICIAESRCIAAKGHRGASTVPVESFHDHVHGCALIISRNGTAARRTASSYHQNVC